MKAIKTEIPSVVLLEPEVFGDARGYFMERLWRANVVIRYSLMVC